jgi:hypothetical protein
MKTRGIIPLKILATPGTELRMCVHPYSTRLRCTSSPRITRATSLSIPSPWRHYKKVRQNRSPRRRGGNRVIGGDYLTATCFCRFLGLIICPETLYRDLFWWIKNFVEIGFEERYIFMTIRSFSLCFILDEIHILDFFIQFVLNSCKRRL